MLPFKENNHLKHPRTDLDVVLLLGNLSNNHDLKHYFSILHFREEIH